MFRVIPAFSTSKAKRHSVYQDDKVVRIILHGVIGQHPWTFQRYPSMLPEVPYSEQSFGEVSHFHKFGPAMSMEYYF
jgi:hypothetical protein